MILLEVIHLRLTNRESVEIGCLVREMFRGFDRAWEIRLYNQPGITSDVAVHIRRNAETGVTERSGIGQRLAGELRPFGMVQHTVWVEREKNSLDICC